jgi:hypothetical protein
VGVAECVPKELDAGPVDGAEELELVFTKLATGGPGNVYSMGGLKICVIISDMFARKSDTKE